MSSTREVLSPGGWIRFSAFVQAHNDACSTGRVARRGLTFPPFLRVSVIPC